MNELHQRALRAIDERRDELVSLSQAIHANPELGYQEREATRLISSTLESAGFAVTRGYRGIETSYRADAPGKGAGPTIAILAEYDALNGLGHGCGHNLIAMMGTGAAIGVRAVIGELGGKLAAIGTPAEEGGGGKVALIKAGGFDDVDVAMMIHPSSRTLASRTSLASNRVELEFFGKAAHAAAQPDRGINALDGVIQTFNAVNAMRQQLQPDARVHGIITAGGTAANIIPEYAQAKFSVRALDRRYQKQVLERFIACAEGAATATGTKLKVTVNEVSGYENMVPIWAMADRWATHMRALGLDVLPTTDDERMGSTDMGNVSQMLPSIHPYIAIAPEGTPGHSIAFRDAAAAQPAHDAALVAAKAMALTVIDLFSDPRLLEKAKAEFAELRAKGLVKGKR